jgi:hypothetical protein
MRQALVQRLCAAESRSGLGQSEQPTLFVRIEDASMPDPDLPAPEPFGADSDVIGVHGQLEGRGARLTRNEGESLVNLQKRAKRLAPQVRMWFFEYASLPSAAFQNLPDVGGQA